MAQNVTKRSIHHFTFESMRLSVVLQLPISNRHLYVLSALIISYHWSWSFFPLAHEREQQICWIAASLFWASTSLFSKKGRGCAHLRFLRFLVSIYKQQNQIWQIWAVSIHIFRTHFPLNCSCLSRFWAFRGAVKFGGQFLLYARSNTG